MWKCANRTSRQIWASQIFLCHQITADKHSFLCVGMTSHFSRSFISVSSSLMLIWLRNVFFKHMWGMMSLFFKKKEMRISLHGLFGMWHQRLPLTSEQIRSYHKLSSNLGNSWKALGWKQSLSDRIHNHHEIGPVFRSCMQSICRSPVRTWWSLFLNATLLSFFSI